MKKINRLNANVVSPWVDIDFQLYHTQWLSILYEHCNRPAKVFKPNCGSCSVQCNYKLPLKLSKEISFGNFAIDNTVLFSQKQHKMNLF
jgi:hypothetical protein